LPSLRRIADGTSAGQFDVELVEMPSPKLKPGRSPVRDIVMLGIGPDGHIASLFPGFPQLDVDDQIAVGVTGSPKPPPERISLTCAACSRHAFYITRAMETPRDATMDPRSL